MSARIRRSFVVTQLFLTGELWGIEADSLAPEKLKAHAGTEFPFFPCTWLERLFVTTLRGYLAFSRQWLQTTGRLKVRAGFSYVYGYRMAAPHGMRSGGVKEFAGSMINNDFTWEKTIPDGADAATILRPFSKTVGGVRADAPRQGTAVLVPESRYAI